MKDNGIIGSFHPAGKLLGLLILSFVSVSIVAFLGMLIAIPFFDISFIDLIEGGINVDDEKMIAFNKYMQSLSQIGLFIIPAILYAFLAHRNIPEYYSLNVKPDLRQVFIGICVLFASFPLISFLVDVNMQMSLPEYLGGLERWMVNAEENAKILTEQFLKADSVNGLLINILIIAVIPAIGEELLFRGAIQRIFHQWTGNHHLAVWLAALVFSAMHIQFFGFLPRLFLGVMFGYLYLYSGSMWLAIIAHFVNNATAVIAYYFYHNQITNYQLDDIGKGDMSSYLVMLSIVIVSLLMFAFWKIGKQRKSEWG